MNVVGTITLPAAPVTAQAGNTQFYLSVLQDADFITNPLFPTSPPRDSVTTSHRSPSRGDRRPPNCPNFPRRISPPRGVVAPLRPVAWGQNFQVTTTVQNLGRADAGPFHQSSLFDGGQRSLDRAIYLGEAAIDGLKAGYNQQIIQTLNLPARLPSGLTSTAWELGRSRS